MFGGRRSPGWAVAGQRASSRSDRDGQVRSASFANTGHREHGGDRKIFRRRVRLLQPVRRGSPGQSRAEGWPR
jgi:hypothetical protein